MVSETRDRGQLILVAAISIAFIILGLVVVFNGVLYTETVSSSGTSGSVTDAETVEYEIEQGVRGLVQQQNLAGDPPDSDEFESTYRSSINDEKPAIVAIERVDGVQEAAFESGSISPGDVANSEQVGQFRVKMNLDNSDPGDRLGLEIDSDTVDIEYTGTELAVTGDVSCTIDTSGQDDVWVDFTSGAVGAKTQGSCEFDLIDSTDTTTTITVTSSTDIDGEYELITKNSGSRTWTAEVEYTYDSADVSIERTIEVDVYGDRT
ncbi:DUF7261 family protein [Salinilacihabitans rarus]|uniref:DUF7261 family protein n=1 Tax=Salinilacihabitans rarus TaxID=2961596 RepID=UPI0020C84742|nr:hypothetical protein [Salinilacihabitans rarus]